MTATATAAITEGMSFEEAWEIVRFLADRYAYLRKDREQYTTDKVLALYDGWIAEALAEYEQARARWLELFNDGCEP